MSGEQERTPQWGQGLVVTGNFEVQAPSVRLAQNNRQFLVFRVDFGGVSVPVFVWPNECEGPMELGHGDRIHLVGRTERYQGRNQVRARRIAPAQSRQFREWAWDRIRLIYQWLHPPVLKEFLEAVLLDQELGRLFGQLPASQRHHHAYPGGLLEHSVDVAWRVFRQSSDSAVEDSLATVAALFHDIGKLQAYREEGGYTPSGEQVRHDQFTLEVLGPALELLDREWPQGAARLRSILVDAPKDPEGRLRAWKRAIREADQASAALNRRSGIGEG